MSLPLFLRGLVVVLIAFAVATYLITGSAWTTFIDTVIVAVLLQIGYFAVVLFLVWRTPHTPQADRSAARREAAQGAAAEQQPATKVVRVPGNPTSPRS